ncbi:MAG: DNA recombination protein RmuC [Candidatus Zixiibacteriota bacterium]|nr:MAG: DNA recombination protein RmuC [candidate division Zixibacteria bacterium]
MDLSTVVNIVLLVLIAGLVVYLSIRIRRQETEATQRLENAIQLFKAEMLGKQAESMISIKDTLESAHRAINDSLVKGTGSLDKKMAVFAEIHTQLGRLATQASSIETIGKNIQSLSELLRPPQLRGKLGEIFLENLLAEILPPAMFEIQHRFPNGQRVDAIIKLGKRLLPIDAKFPLEAFQRLMQDSSDTSARKAFHQALKKHVDDIADKYIRPGENTTDFAILYIPAEAVYYELVSADDATAFQYALSRHVIPSSPGHLYGFLASLSAVYSEIQMAQMGLSEGSRSLSLAVQELTDTAATLSKLHDRMEGSLRQLTLAFEKARNELNKVKYSLDKLKELPTAKGQAEQ